MRPTITSVSPVISMSGSHSNAMQRAQIYILNNLEQPLTIAQIAKHLYQSESTLKRKFKAAFDTSIYQFIQAARVQKAQSILDTGNFTIHQTAYKVGYTNASHFSRAFKKHVGCNPREYLKSSIVNP